MSTRGGEGGGGGAAHFGRAFFSSEYDGRSKGLAVTIVSNNNGWKGSFLICIVGKISGHVFLWFCSFKSKMAVGSVFVKCAASLCRSEMVDPFSFPQNVDCMPNALKGCLRVYQPLAIICLKTLSELIGKPSIIKIGGWYKTGLRDIQANRLTHDWWFATFFTRRRNNSPCFSMCVSGCLCKCQTCLLWRERNILVTYLLTFRGHHGGRCRVHHSFKNQS